MYTHTEVIDLETTQTTLPDLATQLFNGQVVIVTRGGQELAVMMGIDEYRRLKEIEEEQREHDGGFVLTHVSQDEMTPRVNLLG